MDVTLLIGGRHYPVPDHAAGEVRDRIRGQAADDRLRYLADAISEDLDQA